MEKLLYDVNSEIKTNQTFQKDLTLLRKSYKKTITDRYKRAIPIFTRPQTNNNFQIGKASVKAKVHSIIIPMNRSEITEKPIDKINIEISTVLKVSEIIKAAKTEDKSLVEEDKITNQPTNNIEGLILCEPPEKLAGNYIRRNLKNKIKKYMKIEKPIEEFDPHMSYYLHELSNLESDNNKLKKLILMYYNCQI